MFALQYCLLFVAAADALQSTASSQWAAPRASERADKINGNWRADEPLVSVRND